MPERFPVLGLAVAALVLAGACGGGGHRTTATGQTQSASATTASTANVTGSPTSASGAVPGASKTTAAPATAAAANSAATAGAASKPPSSSTAVGAAPGHYTYDVSGSRSGGTSPTTAPVTGKATLTVDPPQATDQHETLVSDDGSGSGTELVLRFLADGLRLVDLKITGQFSKEFHPNPPVLAEPLPQSKDAHWTWDMTSTDNSTTAHGDYRITGTDSKSTGCQPVACGVVDGTLVIHTTFNGAPLTITLTTTRVDSPKYSITVKEHDVTDVPGLFHSDTSSVIESVVPK